MVFSSYSGGQARKVKIKGIGVFATCGGCHHKSDKQRQTLRSQQTHFYLQAAAETLLATPRGIAQHTHTHTSGVARGRTRSQDNWFFDNLFAAETLLGVAISGFVSLFR
ncbi:hypothetical protein ACLKA7_005537 [Drosophila subpalustris]